jgi:hypothetical protein
MTRARKSAKGEECTLHIAGICGYSTDTTVLCHLHSDSKGMGNKSQDVGSAIYACHKCHSLALDDKSSQFWKEEPYFYILRALQRTIKRMIEKGIIKIA